MLDYTVLEKKTLPVKLIDGRVVVLTAPKKALYAKLTAIEETLKNTSDALATYDEILQMTADILSNNREGVRFSPTEVDEIMDVEDMALLIFEYGKFAGKVTSNPN